MSSDSTSNNVDKIVESNIPAEPSKSFEFSCAHYEFMLVPTELSSSESSVFLSLIQQMISNFSFFSGCLKFVPKSSIISLEELVMCPPRHHVYIIFSFIEVMSKVPTALHLSYT